MNDQTDSELLRAYSDTGSEVAFAELVRRHVDFVYSAAHRMVCDSHLAEDVTQGVFVALAKGSTQLQGRPVLSGWLHRTAQNIAAQTVRTIERRRFREREAAAMNELLSGNPDATWEQISPHLDAALGELSESDRDALLLRYFERKSAREMAQTLGISDEAAQRRVSRAVERLREFFAKRGIGVGASGLVAVIGANAVHAAPLGLAATISTTVAFAGSAACTTVAATAAKAIAMTTLQKSLVIAVLVVASVTAIYQARQAAVWRARYQEIHEQAGEQMQQAQREHDEAIRQADAVQARSQKDFAELIRSRGDVARLRQQLADLAATRQATVASPAPRKSDAELLEPVQIFVANADARVPVGHTLAMGGWATAAGRRTIMLVRPTVVDEVGNVTTVNALGGRPGQVVLEGHIFEMPDEILDETIANLHLPGMDKLKTDEKATTSHSLFTSDEADLLLKTLNDTAEVQLLSAPRVLTAEGRQAVLSVTENKMVAGREQALGPSLDVEPKIAADGSVNMTVIARLRRAGSP